MLKIRCVFLMIVLMILPMSCATSSNTTSIGAELGKYRYATISNVMDYGGSASLMDMEVKVFNRLHNTRLTMIGDKEINNLSDLEKMSLLLVRFSAQTGSWGGNTVSINFVDYITGRPIASVSGKSVDIWVPGDNINAAIDGAIDEAVKLFSR